MTESDRQHTSAGDGPRDFVPPHLDAELGGSLPCAFCGYELKGLSIRSVCPECGTAVRATILYKVDPQAEEFQPIRHSRLRAACLVLWSLGALVTALAFWLMRGADLVEVLQLGVKVHVGNWAGPVAVVAATISGLSLLPLVRPVEGLPAWKSACVVIALAAYGPLVWTLVRLVRGDEGPLKMPYFDAPADPMRHMHRLVIGVCAMMIVVSFRPVARDLVKRSLALRTGRVDRQTLLGMGFVLAIVAGGDVLGLVASSVGKAGAALPLISSVVIGVGSVIMTLGLLSALIDSWRIARAILVPSPSLRQVIEGTPRPARR